MAPMEVLGEESHKVQMKSSKMTNNPKKLVYLARRDTKAQPSSQAQVRRPTNERHVALPDSGTRSDPPVGPQPAGGTIGPSVEWTAVNGRCLGGPILSWRSSQQGHRLSPLWWVRSLNFSERLSSD